ncbi:MAG: hypothetical protein HYX44_08990 [Aquabacterium sp.]|nr:hypothetical protein [Aquabacterium sp.]
MPIAARFFFALLRAFSRADEKGLTEALSVFFSSRKPVLYFVFWFGAHKSWSASVAVVCGLAVSAPCPARRVMKEVEGDGTHHAKSCRAHEQQASFI